MKLTLRKSDWLDDWYLIERAEHDGREWFEVDPARPNCAFLQRSARLGDADTEGTAAEMLAIAGAIETGGSAAFLRCAAERTETGYLIGSPRNSSELTPVTFADAGGLAAEIRGKLE
jgi:hypothetical protein